ncbi:GNAT family N-acetyltransferase [Nocardioides coralli]|uniref:GNAT family N-acetyltransferase n=1 Tax=Nocardioides coralli TaxID=2872154 RepID=UPI001CA41F3F|nr:GNAT family protein [Nocardioides coralli]QZY28225.1 GNAT family N-acetyltransferase [Nocardioides coralli]
MTRVNDHGQPVGDEVPGWTTRLRPTPVVLEGRHVRLEPLAPAHAAPLLESLGGAANADLWTYRIDLEPPATLEQAAALIAAGTSGPDQLTFAVVPLSEGVARGITSLYRIDPGNGSIEVGGIVYARSLQRTPASTEATYLVARHVFDDLGYRRLEWKLDSCNEPSAAAARRLGFTYEGRHRQAIVYKGRNRDTDWFSIIDTEWPAVRARIESWLDPANFDSAGRQRRRLSSPA